MISESHTDYVYIAGRGFSGSTLLELLLGRHRDMVAIGEVEKLSLQFARDEKAVYPGKCSCGRRPMDCPLWGAVADAIKDKYGTDLRQEPFGFRVSDVGLEEDYGIRSPGHWLLFKYTRLLRYLAYDRTPLLGHLGALSSHRKWALNRMFVADVVRRLANAEVVVDASKDDLGMRDVYEAGRGTVKIAFITRDPRGNVSSTVKRENVSVEQATHNWVKVNGRILRLLRDIPRDDWMHVRYEDLCRDLVGTLTRFCGFLGYDYDAAMCEVDRKERHTIGGNPIRFAAVEGVKEDLSWKQRLSAADAERVLQIAGPVAATLGYL